MEQKYNLCYASRSGLNSRLVGSGQISVIKSFWYSCFMTCQWICSPLDLRHLIKDSRVKEGSGFKPVQLGLEYNMGTNVPPIQPCQILGRRRTHDFPISKNRFWRPNIFEKPRFRDRVNNFPIPEKSITKQPTRRDQWVPIAPKLSNTTEL